MRGRRDLAGRRGGVPADVGGGVHVQPDPQDPEAVVHQTLQRSGLRPAAGPADVRRHSGLDRGRRGGGHRVGAAGGRRRRRGGAPAAPDVPRRPRRDPGRRLPGDGPFQRARRPRLPRGPALRGPPHHQRGGLRRLPPVAGVVRVLRRHAGQLQVRRHRGALRRARQSRGLGVLRAEQAQHRVLVLRRVPASQGEEQEDPPQLQ
mmetsp:Transcript_34036/g.95807  ORF Transcript_34036/g.95807 Transcript_34036/m.95807 type:complete len:204 (+) Transcript_34036:379-990(+)